MSEKQHDALEHQLATVLSQSSRQVNLVDQDYLNRFYAGHLTVSQVRNWYAMHLMLGCIMALQRDGEYLVAKNQTQLTKTLHQDQTGLHILKPVLERTQGVDQHVLQPGWAMLKQALRSQAVPVILGDDIGLWHIRLHHED